MKKMKSMVLIGMFLLILLTPSCNTFSWDPTGIWNFMVTCSHGVNWIETLPFSGSEDSGTVTGLQLDSAYPGLTGTYNKTGDYTASLSFVYSYVTSTLTLTVSEDAPNSGTGSGVWQEGSWTDPLTFTATKISNLQ